MSAQTRVISVEEADAGFGLLKDIVDIVKNPSSIDAAYEQVTAAASLSEDELKKSNDAREMIKSADSLKADLKSREDALAADKSAHDTIVTDFNAYIESENARLAEFTATLNATAEQQKAIAADLINQKNAIDDSAKKVVADKLLAQQDIAAQLKQIEDAKKDQAGEDARLTEWEFQLKVKSQRLIDAASA